MEKRKVIYICLLFSVSAACFAQDDGQGDMEIDMLIKSGLYRNFEAIKQEAADLDEAERLEIYNRNQLSKWLLFAAPAPFGIGNFVQGDKLWGGIVLTGEIIGIGLFTIGNIMLWGPLLTIIPMFTAQGQRAMEIGTYLIPAGMITAAVFYLSGVIRVFTHLPAYNKKLRTALQLDPITMSIEPSINIAGRGAELTLVFSAAF